METIKRIGRYTVAVEVFGDVIAEVKTLVVPEGGELPPEEELAAMAGGRAGRAAAAAVEPAADVEAASRRGRGAAARRTSRARRAPAEDADAAEPEADERRAGEPRRPGRPRRARASPQRRRRCGNRGISGSSSLRAADSTRFVHQPVGGAVDGRPARVVSWRQMFAEHADSASARGYRPPTGRSFPPNGWVAPSPRTRRRFSTAGGAVRTG